MSTNRKKERNLKCTAVLMESGWFLLVDVSVTPDMRRGEVHVKVSGAGYSRATSLLCTPELMCCHFEV